MFHYYHDNIYFPRYQWYVPIEYKIGASGDIKFQWLKPHSTVLVPFDFEDKDNFLRLNMNSAGYYVVNYSHDLRSRLNNYLDNKDNYKVINNIHHLQSAFIACLSPFP